MAWGLPPALGEPDNLLLITNFSGFRLGAVAGGFGGFFYYKRRINDLLITFSIHPNVIGKSDTGQAAAWGLINNLSADNFLGILIGKLSEAGVM